MFIRISSVALISLLLARVASAQTPPAPVFLEGTAGYAAFVDESPINHFVGGGSVRVAVSRRVSIGPEIVYMRGPIDDRKLFLTGIAVVDLVDDERKTAATIVPFVVAGGGVTRMRSRTGTGVFTSWEGALTGGAGVRLPIGHKWYVAPDVRVGWEPHIRIGVAIGVR